MEGKQYYYTQALHAACMAMDHGMDFVCVHGEEIWICEKTYFMNDCLTCKGMTDKAYIHPDSLRLLEPRPGDFVIDDMGDLAKISQCGKYLYMTGISEGFSLNGSEKIIQRDGKPFFWPECEVEDGR